MTTPQPYRESDDHVPDPTAVYAQLDTSGLGGLDKITDVTPVFRESAAQELVDASAALRDQGASATNVVLPDDPGLADRAVALLHERADRVREGDGLARDPDSPAGRVDVNPDLDATVDERAAVRAHGVVDDERTDTDPLAGEVAADLKADDARRESDPGVAADQAAEADQLGVDGDTLDRYDPKDHSVAEVKTHLDKSDDAERQRVLAAERAGANRKGIIEYQPPRGD